MSHFIRENFRKFRTDVEIEKTAEAERGVFTLHLKEEKPLKYLILKEDITKGQRVEKFRVEADGKTVATGTTIGYQRILPLGGIVTKELRVVLEEYRACPVMESIRVS